MSHTGSVIRPNQSPGLIRMITLGFVITKDGELVFAIPPELPDKRKNLPDKFKASKDYDENAHSVKITELKEIVDNQQNPWIESARERFVVFLGTKRKYKYGEAVRFNLKLYDPTTWGGFFNPEDLEELEKAIPQRWRDNFGNDDFQFKYIATEVKKLPKKFVLYPLYRFIRDMNPDTADNVLMELRKLENFAIDANTTIQITHDRGMDRIKNVRIVDYDTFNVFYSEKQVYIKDFLTFAEVEQEIINFRQHFISSCKEIPTWQRE